MSAPVDGRWELPEAVTKVLGEQLTVAGDRQRALALLEPWHGKPLTTRSLFVAATVYAWCDRFDLLDAALDGLSGPEGDINILNYFAYFWVSKLALGSVASRQGRMALGGAALAMADHAIGSLHRQPAVGVGADRMVLEAALADTRALALIVNGQPDEALRQMDAVGPDGLPASSQAAMCCTRALAELRLGRKKQAKKLRRQAFDLDPEAALLPAVDRGLER